MEAFVTLRGKECIIDDIEMQPAEPDVGIFSAYPDSFAVFFLLENGLKGEEISEPLTEEELQLIYKAIRTSMEGEDA